MSVALGVLAELELRAGASDTNRPAWLAERAGGVTATEVRDLYMRQITVSALIAKKLGPPEPPLTSQYVVWGNTREPIIAGVVRDVYQIEPESRVFHAADNPRFLASPDGVGVSKSGALVVDEIKTSKDDITLRSAAFAKKGYAAQMTWSMRVTGARWCLYVSEQHDSDWQDRGGPAYEPQPIGLVPVMEWFEYDEALAAELETIAIGFLVALDAARDGSEVMPVIDEELDTLAVNYLRGLDAEKEGKALKESSYKEIIALVDAGEPVVQESSLARVSWSPEIVAFEPRSEIDVDGAKAAAPAGLYERLGQAQDDFDQAQEALKREQLAVDSHELAFVHDTGVERVVKKKAALRVTAAKSTKESLTVTSVTPKKETK